MESGLSELVIGGTMIAASGFQLFGGPYGTGILFMAAGLCYKALSSRFTRAGAFEAKAGTKLSVGIVLPIWLVLISLVTGMWYFTRKGANLNLEGVLAPATAVLIGLVFLFSAMSIRRRSFLFLSAYSAIVAILAYWLHIRFYGVCALIGIALMFSGTWHLMKFLRQPRQVGSPMP